MCIDGWTQLGSSSDAALTTPNAGFAASFENSGVPQVPQNSRVTSLPLSPVTEYARGSPLVTARLALGTMRTLENGPPEAYWQSRQWQKADIIGSAEHR
jgi:hypothetical protein